MFKETEPQEINQTTEQIIPKGGYKDPRFETPAMTLGLNADNVPEDFKNHLQNGGTKIEG